jgi:hypothetical protein
MAIGMGCALDRVRCFPPRVRATHSNTDSGQNSSTQAGGLIPAPIRTVPLSNVWPVFLEELSVPTERSTNWECFCTSRPPSFAQGFLRRRGGRTEFESGYLNIGATGQSQSARAFEEMVIALVGQSVPDVYAATEKSRGGISRRI